MLPSGARTGLGDDWIRIGGMKMVSDGSISERDAWVSEPYVGRPDDFGIQVKTGQQLFEDARAPFAAGWQIGTHANGDQAIDMVFRVYERLQKETPRPDPRFRIEHCTIIKRRPGAPHQGARRHPNAVLQLRLLSRRKDERLMARSDSTTCSR